MQSQKKSFLKQNSFEEQEEGEELAHKAQEENNSTIAELSIQNFNIFSPKPLGQMLSRQMSTNSGELFMHKQSNQAKSDFMKTENENFLLDAASCPTNHLDTEEIRLDTNFVKPFKVPSGSKIPSTQYAKEPQTPSNLEKRKRKRNGFLREQDVENILNDYNETDEIKNYDFKVLNLIRDKVGPGDLLSAAIKEAQRNHRTKYNSMKLTKILRKHANFKYTTRKSIFFKAILLRKNFFFRIREKSASIYQRIKQKQLQIKSTFSVMFDPLDPEFSARQSWNIVIFVCVLCDLVFLPLYFAFGSEIFPSENSWSLLYFIIAFFFVLDLLLNFNTSFYYEGNIIRDRKKIFKNYLHGSFWLDFLFLLSFACNLLEMRLNSSPDSNDHLSSLRYFGLIRIIDVVKLNKLTQQFGERLQNSSLLNGILALVKLSMTISLLAHWCACIWYLIGDSQKDENWILKDKVIDSGVSDRYVASLYFAITTMLTVGYGDIAPATTVERVYTIFVMLLGGGMFGYTLNSIANILHSLEGEKSKIRRRIHATSNYLRKEGVTADVQAEIKQYLEFIFDKENTGRKSEKETLNLLPEHLQKKVYNQLNSKFIHQNPALQNNFSQKFLYELMSEIKEKIYGPEEIIYGTNDQNFSFYFINKGSANVFPENIATPIFTLQKGAHFGEICFFTAQSRTVTIKSVYFSQLLFISRNSFLKILKNFPTDKEMFHHIKDNISLYNQYTELKTKCLACGTSDHIARGCPRLHYQPNKPRIIQNYLSNFRLFQKDFQRNSRKRFYPLLGLQTLRTHAQDLFVSLGGKGISLNELGLPTETSEIGSYSPQTVIRDSNVTSIAAATSKSRVSLKKKRKKNNSTQIQFQEKNYFEDDFAFDQVKNYQMYFPHNNIIKITDTKHRLYKYKELEVQLLRNRLGKIFKDFDKKNSALLKSSSKE